MRIGIVQTVGILITLGAIMGCETEKPTEPEPVPTTPVIAIISPEGSEVIGDDVLVDINATDDKGITKVELFLDNVIPIGGTMVVPPYRYSWKTDSLADSSIHSLHAKAYDADDNMSSTPVRFVRVYNLKPSNVSFVFGGDSTVTVRWKDNSTKETGFEIDQRVNDGMFAPIEVTGMNDTSIVKELSISAGDSVTFRVRAVTSNKQSAYVMSEIQRLVFPSPDNLIVRTVSQNEVVIDWIDRSTFEWGFEIFRGEDVNQMTLIHTAPRNATTAVIPGAYDVTKKYYFKVRAYTSRNNSPFSNISAATQDTTLVLIEGGTFQMGSTNIIDIGASPVHTVTLDSFWIMKTEVTQKEWRTVVEWKQYHGGTTLNAHPSYQTGDDLPVDRVNWNDVQLWLSHLNEMKMTQYFRLPTEAEWEYAARGGKKSNGYTYSGSDNIDLVSWNYYNSSLVTHPVATKLPNELGLFDMSGNVYEWCHDWYGSYSANGQLNPTGPTTGTYRVIRSGSALHDVGSRVTYRAQAAPDIGAPQNTHTFGFRYVYAP